MKKKHFLPLLTVFLAACLFLTACNQPDGLLLDQPVFIRGRLVYEVIGVMNAEITLMKDGSPVEVITSNDEGHFEFFLLEKGNYKIVPQKHGWNFLPFQAELSITEDSPDELSFTGSAAAGYDIDAWGYVWEEQLRSGTWQEAMDFCAVNGGRLPTATEIYRNSHSRDTGKHVGIYGGESQLWTRIQYEPDMYVTISLADGTSGHSTTSDAVKNYRRIWDDKERDTFSGTYIYSDPGDKGYPVNMNGKRYYMDRLSRPKLTRNSSIREAAFYHAVIPPQWVYSAAITDGLEPDPGIGATENHWTSDMTGHNTSQYCVQSVRWGADPSAYNASYSTYISHLGTKHGSSVYEYHFRLTGLPEYPSEVFPSLSTDIWFDPASRLKVLSYDEEPGHFMNALTRSFDKGAHIPYAQELTRLIQAGLPSGSNNWLWTADFGYNDAGTPNSNMSIVLRWAGLTGAGQLFDFTGYGVTFSQMSSTTINAANTHSYRYIYYPIDPEYSGPPPSVNRDQLFYLEKERPDGEILKIWIDLNDSPMKATYIEAVQECRNREGMLPSARDFMELISQGLPNGTRQYNWTSTANYTSSMEVIYWDGTYPAMTGSWQSNILNSSYGTTTSTFYYRCMWTNELRLQ